MAMKIFLVLNCLGIVYLLYVLANFWKEGRRPNNNARRYAAGFGPKNRVDVAVVTELISHKPEVGLTIIPFPARAEELAGAPDRISSAREPIEMPLRRISTR